MLNEVLTHIKILNEVSECLENNIHLSLHGMGIGEKALCVYGVNKKCVVVCSSLYEMGEYKAILKNLGKKVEDISYCPSSPIFSYKEDSLSMQNFVSTLFDFYLGKIDVLLVMVDALMQKLPNKTFFEKHIGLEVGKNYNFQNLSQTFLNMGYSRCDYVTQKGEFAIRGDIIDIFATNKDDPIRLDFFGDELEKISFFDIDTMKSFATVSAEEIYPATIYLIEDKNELLNKFNNEIKNIKINNLNYSKITEINTNYLLKIKENTIGTNDGFILPFFDFKDNILSLFAENLIFFDEPKKILNDFENIYNNNLQSINNLIENGELAKIHQNFYFDLKQFIPQKYCLFQNVISTTYPVQKEFNFRTIGTRKYVFNYKALIQDLNIYLASSYKIFLFAGSEQSKKSIGNLLVQNNLSYTDIYEPRVAKGQIILSSQILECSASFLESGIIFIGTSDLVRYVRKIQTKQKKRTSVYLPKIGDYVVHSTHGIGKCINIEKLNLNGTEKDYFVLQYKGGDILYVPSEQADLISAFLGAEGEPKLNKIGGQEFAKIKEKVKLSVKELAFDLVKLYANREKQKGVKYEPSYLLDEFENCFEYELTQDQLQAINDIKQDLQTGKIMDRLICGDVGYGKTEVALRAAYNVVLGGKQVAFLCPTTILSEQHYKTTLNRTKDFMCRVAVINRFKTKQQIEQILKDLANGEIDIIIGTHRLLSNDVKFKDLGLLILDEEHRFGVEDKEKIKNLKQNIDVLTLSATPIPRTLNMAMTGIRDISIIETAPKNRLPVQTFVVEQNPTLIQDACKKELARGGQVLIVFNSVEKIYQFGEEIKNMFPNNKIGIAHGQMPSKVLEDVIFKLYSGELDILVATTLIENGIDLPRANTLIVIDADKLGLSQLYQLKGRIGRSDKLGYAYFTFNPNKVLTEDAYKRLDAITEFAELGSGFKIAMRDLEIRGAGNVLGKEQHGHMAKVGYDLYCKILGETVRELKGQKVAEQLECKIDISCPAFLNQDYIKDESERIKQYSDLSQIKSYQELLDLLEQTQSVYGVAPTELVNLYKIALIKNLCIKVEAKRILCNSTTTRLYLYKKPTELISKKVVDAVNHYGNVCVIKFEEVPIIEMKINNLTLQNKLEFIIKFLNECINN